VSGLVSLLLPSAPAVAAARSGRRSVGPLCRCRRCRCGIEAGDRVLLVGEPVAGVPAVYPPVSLDALLPAPARRCWRVWHERLVRAGSGRDRRGVVAVCPGWASGPRTWWVRRRLGRRRRPSRPTCPWSPPRSARRAGGRTGRTGIVCSSTGLSGGLTSPPRRRSRHLRGPGPQKDTPRKGRTAPEGPWKGSPSCARKEHARTPSTHSPRGP